MGFLAIPAWIWSVVQGVVTVGGSAGVAYWDYERRHGDDKDKRDNAASQLRANVIVQLNATGLRHDDLRRLQHLHFDVIDAGTAVVSGKDFEVEGNVTLHEEEAAPGLRTGDLSFRIPGLEAEMSGQFVFVNQTAADNKTRADFANAHGQLIQMPAGFLTGPTEEMIQKAAEEVVCAEISAEKSIDGTQ